MGWYLGSLKAILMRMPGKRIDAGLISPEKHIDELMHTLVALSSILKKGVFYF